MPGLQPAPFSTLLGRTDKPKNPMDDSKTIKIQINVSGLLVFY